jgi:electron transfer flavoprotein alpha subunit
MAEIKIHHEKISDIAALEVLVSLCPFGSIHVIEGKVEIDEGCKMCRLCVKKGPDGVFEFIEDARTEIDKSAWRGVAVFAEYENGRIHPVSLELIGKARELADEIGHPVYALLIGSGILENGDGNGPPGSRCNPVKELIARGADTVFVYDDPALQHILVEPYTNIIEDFSRKVKPSVILAGGTTIGRSLAPRAAARLRTGLTADCTSLTIEDSTDLQQVRPAFGGNIMAHIKTTDHRPQFATVRYKIFPIPKPDPKRRGEIVRCEIGTDKLQSRVRIESVQEKPDVIGIEEADAIVAVGKAFKKKEDLSMAEELAELLGAQIAGTRPTIEAGWIDPRRQIGLSGRTVSPKLLIACGISGSVQWIAGMKGSERVIAVNTDPEAPVFKVAHYGIVGDIYQILPGLIEKIRGKKRSRAHAV